MQYRILYFIFSVTTLGFLIKNMDSFVCLKDKSVTRYLRHGTNKIEFCNVCMSEMQLTGNRMYWTCINRNCDNIVRADKIREQIVIK